MATRDETGTKGFAPAPSWQTMDGVPPRWGAQPPPRMTLPLGMPPPARPYVPGSRGAETTDKTISKDQTLGETYEFLSELFKDALPERGRMPPRPPGFPPSYRPGAPPPASVSRSRSRSRSHSRSRSDSDKDEATHAREELVEKLKEELTELVGESIGRELSTEDKNDRVMSHLLLRLSRLHVENEMMKEELEELRNAEKADPKDEEIIAEEEKEEGVDETLSFITIHRVVDVEAEHDSAERYKHYLDPPRFFKGDTKESMIRGLKETDEDDDYLEKHPNVAFAVVHAYYFDEDDALTILQDNSSKKGVLLKDSAPAESNDGHMRLSAVLSKAIEKVIEKHPDRFPGFESELPTTYETPFLLWYFHNADLRELKDCSDLDDDAKARIDLVCQWMEDNCRTDWDEGNELIARGKIDKKHIRKLLRPNEIVVWPDYNREGSMQAMKVEPYTDMDADYSKVDLLWWGFNGTFFRNSENHIREVVTRSFEKRPRDKAETADITDLMYFPLRFLKDDTRARLIARGMKLYECRRKKLVCYHEPVDGFDVQIEQRYMVDYQMYKRLHPLKGMFNTPSHERNKVLMEGKEQPEDDFFACLPPTVIAFDFSKKSWKIIAIDRISDVTWNKIAFKQLVASEETKELIQAVVTAHGQRTSVAPDIIEGKGQGLLILLHGAPGTGKTLTAESIAEAQERPLYRVTCGDIGTEPKEVEMYLGDVLEIGKEWGCVVLLDEADVFLEERSFTDQKRNAIISIFLRILEYYDGILILTTNRVGSFDEAFKSRIQLALGYPKLTEDDRLKIWRNFIEMLGKTKERIDMEDLKMNLHHLAAEEVNGRQIRNIITMARHLAKFRKEMLKYRHMQDAVRSVQKFTEYLSQVKGGVSDDDWARADKTR